MCEWFILRKKEKTNKLNCILRKKLLDFYGKGFYNPNMQYSKGAVDDLCGCLRPGCWNS
ncbi:hypothetical protein HMPREF3293_02709 [Christensenella minuta]|uniref:Uncharacterized protein n=1 Tax=Christensenella minuta TaxID=626937 RepID=A0A136Q1T2_9FIRM|nr:hypothetical protein HMPREF3293_02709 [Christensenella minuta]